MRFLTFGLAVVLAIAFVAACGGNDDSGEVPAVTDSGHATPAPDGGRAEPQAAVGTEPTTKPNEAKNTARPEPTTEPTETQEHRRSRLAPVRMTVEAYAEACDEKDQPDGYLDVTPWGEVGDHTEEVVAWLKDMNPPEELEAYHEALILLAEETLAFARSKPQDEVGSSQEALADFSAFDSLNAVIAAIEAADPETRAAMVAGGCW